MFKVLPPMLWLESHVKHQLWWAGDLELLKELLANGGDVNDADDEGRTGLHFACGYGEITCMNLLLEHDAKVNATDHNKNTALHYAAGYGQVECVEVLLNKCASPTFSRLFCVWMPHKMMPSSF
jgi:ankyrin repeat protein